MLKDDMTELKKVRIHLQENADILRKAREDFEEKNKALMDEIKHTKVHEYDLVELIHKEALDIYNADPDKKKSIGFGVNIKTLSIISFDEKAAEAWCLKHGSIAMKLDTAKFKKLAQVQDIPCVSIDDKDTVTITKNIVIGDGD